MLPPQYSIARKTETIEEILARLRATPDVESAGFTRAGILIGEAITLGTFVPPGRTVDEMRAGPLQAADSSGQRRLSDRGGRPRCSTAATSSRPTQPARRP